MNTVCLLLNEKQNWETSRKLLSDTNFLEKLKFFDKDNIPNGI
jgi:dynein heavy chain